MLRSFLFVSVVNAVGTGSKGALELTPVNWDKEVSKKTVFIKFFAPWCGHCKKLKPDWDRLASDFIGSPTALVAEVDCTATGKPLCEKNGVSSYPALKWGHIDNLSDYTGARNYADMKGFADQHLGNSCGPGSLELCDERTKARFDKFMRISPDKLKTIIGKADKQLQIAEHTFAAYEQQMTEKIRLAANKKEMLIKSIKEQQGLPKGPAEGSLELTAANWDNIVAGKTLFIKFFAPWCGHCKAIKPDWDRLMADFDGTSTALVAEVDCTGDGRSVCDKFGVTGFPRLMWGSADKLAIYSGTRSYADLRKFADDHLGKRCEPGNLEVCEESHKAIMTHLTDMSPKALDAKMKAVDEAVDKAEKAYFDEQWNLTGNIDIAEQKKDATIKAIKDQGLAEAKQIEAWNSKQPPGFWKPQANAIPPVSPLDFLDETLFEFADMKVTNLMALVTLAALVLAGATSFMWRRSSGGGKTCSLHHILMTTEEDILRAKVRIEAGEDFAKIALECSVCPSGKSGGYLGVRQFASMEPEVKAACFDRATALGQVVGPVKTRYGLHLLMVDSRLGVPEPLRAAPSESAKDK